MGLFLIAFEMTVVIGFENLGLGNALVLWGSHRFLEIFASVNNFTRKTNGGHEFPTSNTCDRYLISICWLNEWMKQLTLKLNS